MEADLSPAGPCNTTDIPSINISSPEGFSQRLAYPPEQTVLLILVSDLTLSQGLLFDGNYSCTILTANQPRRTLSLEHDSEPVLRIWSTHNVMTIGVSFNLPVTERSAQCEDMPDEGRTGIICPAVHVWASTNVQIVKVCKRSVTSHGALWCPTFSPTS